MSTFDEAAVHAARLAQGGAMLPQDAWRKVTEKFTRAMREKSCPRCAFLELCDGGYVKEIKPGRYSAPNAKKMYAVDAVKLLTENPALADGINAAAILWKMLAPRISYNRQMHVVLGLWNEDLIRKNEN